MAPQVFFQQKINLKTDISAIFCSYVQEYYELVTESSTETG